MRRALITVAVLAGIAFIALRPGKHAIAPNSAPNVSRSNSSVSPAGTRSARSLVTAPRTEPETPGQRLARLLNSTNEVREHSLSPLEVGEYLQKHKTNAFTLVTAFCVSRDREFLKTAAALYPDDPLVQSQVLLHNLLPDERQKWIDALKQSSPGNALPGCLAARDLFNKGDRTAALRDVFEVRDKKFDDFTREVGFGQEEAYLAAGRSPVDAKAFGTAEVLLPHLSQMKQLGQGFAEHADELGKSGDAAGQAAFLQGAFILGQQLRTSGHGGPLITELVGLAIENIGLNRWPQSVPAPFLNEPVAQRQEANRLYRAEIRQNVRNYDQWMQNASENDLISYFDRMRTFGEYNAVGWIKNQQPASGQ